jgi:hypothetical protein
MAGTSELYLRISYKSKDSGVSSGNRGRLNWKLDIGEKKHRVCGGMYSKNSGTVIFKVSNIEEAVDVVRKASIEGSDSYKYEINYKLLAV